MTDAFQAWLQECLPDATIAARDGTRRPSYDAVTPNGRWRIFLIDAQVHAMTAPGCCDHYFRRSYDLAAPDSLRQLQQDLRRVRRPVRACALAKLSNELVTHAPDLQFKVHGRYLDLQCEPLRARIYYAHEAFWLHVDDAPVRPLGHCRCPKTFHRVRAWVRYVKRQAERT